MNRNRLIFVAIGILVALALVWHPPSGTPMAQISAAPQTIPHRRPARVAASALAVVYVAGAVRHPGLYRVRAGGRADDAVRSAGGFQADADPTLVNLAARVSDGEEVLIPVLGAPAPRATRSRRPQTKASAPVDPVDVNTATAGELATVPGIGKTIAERIVEVRDRDGAYQTLDDLLDVAGMTSSRLARAERFLHI